MIKKTKDIYARFNGRYPSYAKIFRFLISGGISFSTDIVLLYLFTDIFGIWYLTSAIAAFIFAFIVSFSLMKFWTFSDSSRDGIHTQIGIYFFVAVINLTLNTILVYAFVEWVNLYYIFAQIVASALIAIESFFVYKNFIFRKTNKV